MAEDLSIEEKKKLDDEFNNRLNRSLNTFEKIQKTKINIYEESEVEEEIEEEDFLVTIDEETDEVTLNKIGEVNLEVSHKLFRLIIEDKKGNVKSNEQVSIENLSNSYDLEDGDRLYLDKAIVALNGDIYFKNDILEVDGKNITLENFTQISQSKKIRKLGINKDRG